MAASDQLSRLAARAKEAEDHVAAAKGKAKADIEQDASLARATAEDQADQLRETADSSRDRVSAWWNDVQRSWNQHIAAVRENIDRKRAEHDQDRA
jgi:hypothetical protein